MRLLLSVLFIVALVSAVGCSSDGDDDDNDDDAAGDDDSGDDDTGDDDTADDDSGDDDTGGDDDFSCAALTDEELAMFTTIFCAGSSNSHSWSMLSPPFAPDRLSKWYHGKVIEKLWENLGECVDYEPEFWIYWYTDVGNVRPETTLSWAVDAFYHYLDDGPSPEVFRQRISGYLDTLFGPEGLADGVYFLSANVPKLMMFGVPAEEQDLMLTIIEEELAERVYTSMLDLNYWIEHLVDGTLVYNGETLKFFDVMKPDLIHAKELGQQLIADLYIMELNDLWPNLKIEQYGLIEVVE